jgi:hypothetical protein
MTTTPIARTGPAGAAPPRRVPRRVHTLQAVLLAALSTLLLDLIVLPSAAHLPAVLVLGVTVILVGLLAQQRCWGTLNSPAHLPSRLSLGALGLVMVYVLSMFTDAAGTPWRWTVALLAPTVFYVLMRWDDARTVELLRARSAKERPPVGTVVP